MHRSSALACRRGRVAGLALVATLAGAGCIKLNTLDVGYAQATSGRDGHSGLAVNFRDGTVGTAKGRAVASSLAVRTKFASELFQIAIGPDFALSPYRFGRFTTFARAGFHLFQFEEYEDEFAFGAYSPYAEGGVMFPFNAPDSDVRYFVNAGLALEYNVRATEQPSSGYIAFFIGVGRLNTIEARDFFSEKIEVEQAPTMPPPVRPEDFDPILGDEPIEPLPDPADEAKAGEGDEAKSGEGEGEGAKAGEGETPKAGEGDASKAGEGEGEAPKAGEGEAPKAGEGEAPKAGEGETPKADSPDDPNDDIDQ